MIDGLAWPAASPEPTSLMLTNERFDRTRRLEGKP